MNLCIYWEQQVAQQFSLAWNNHFETIGEKKTATEFVRMPYDHATSMIERQDFPANIESLSITFGLILNIIW